MRKVLSGILGILGIIIAFYGVYMKLGEKSMSVGIIGGADGPTAVFVTENTGRNISVGIIILGIVFVGMSLMIYLKASCIL